MWQKLTPMVDIHCLSNYNPFILALKHLGYNLSALYILGRDILNLTASNLIPMTINMVAT